MSTNVRSSSGRMENRRPIDASMFYATLLYIEIAREHYRARVDHGAQTKRWLRNLAHENMTTGRYLTLTSMFLALPGLSLAADSDAGRTKAEACLACHFADDFVGESETDILLLIEATRAADSGHPDESDDLSETDLADIAAFFAAGK